MLKWDPPQVIPKGKIAVARPSKAGGSSSSASLTVEELLDAVVAPRTSLTNDGGQWVQRISSTPATKTDVVRLQESLDQQLLQKQARETGICPVREGLYREGFGAWGWGCDSRGGNMRACIGAFFGGFMAFIFLSCHTFGSLLIVFSGGCLPPSHLFPLAPSPPLHSF